MEFIQVFNWAVPTGFNDAIAQCRFDLGDSLYDTKKAYDHCYMIRVKVGDKNSINILVPLVQSH